MSRFDTYIEKYKDLAVEQCRAYGVPASITLAQGLLESNAGSSALAVNNNNHFGIKWHRRAGVEADSLHGEYSSYASAAECYEDHSRILSSRRYAPLHELDTTDYRGWAHGLRRCGYAEDPGYGPKLIAIIERYKLLRFDSIAMIPVAPAAVLPATVEKPEVHAQRNPNEVPPAPPRRATRDRREVPVPNARSEAAASHAVQGAAAATPATASVPDGSGSDAKTSRRRHNARPETSAGARGAAVGSADNPD